MLVAAGIVYQSGDDRFGITDMGALLAEDHPESVRGIVVMMCDPEGWATWGGLVESIRSGTPGRVRRTGMSNFEYLSQHPEMARTFNAAMSAYTRAAAPELARAYDFSQFDVIADVGGGSGVLISEILRVAPYARGILFDRDSGLESAELTLATAGVARRCRVVPGDFLKAVPVGADAYIMKSVIHDWDDDSAMMLLRNCCRVLSKSGKVLIVERILPDVVTANDLKLLMTDLEMLVWPGGRERTEREYVELADTSGLEVVSISDQIEPFGFRIIEAKSRLG